jgi:hypothetical protein
MMMEPDLYIAYRAWVWGADYDLGRLGQSEAARLDTVAGFMLGGFAVEVQGLRIPEEVAAAQPIGTFLDCRWLLGQDRHLLRGFHFN